MSGTSRHPGDQVIAAFIDGKLSPPEVADISRHLIECRRCRMIVAETTQFRQEARKVASTPRNHMAWLAVAAIVAVAFIGGLLLRQRREPALIARLVDAAPRHHRLVPARLSGFPWAELQAPSRGTLLPNPGDLKLDGVAGAVLEETSDDTDADARHACGVALLLIRRPDESIRTLTGAATAADDARAWNDLAAAHYALAVRDERAAELPQAPTAVNGAAERPQAFAAVNRTAELPQALAAVNRALEKDPGFAEALFNRALILQQMGSSDAARKAWQQYLEVEPRGEWSVEARRHLSRLGGASRRFDPKLFEQRSPAALAQETRVRYVSTKPAGTAIELTTPSTSAMGACQACSTNWPQSRPMRAVAAPSYSFPRSPG